MIRVDFADGTGKKIRLDTFRVGSRAWMDISWIKKKNLPPLRGDAQPPAKHDTQVA